MKEFLKKQKRFLNVWSVRFRKKILQSNMTYDGKYMVGHLYTMVGHLFTSVGHLFTR